MARIDYVACDGAGSVEFLRPTRHKTSHFGDLLPDQCFDIKT